MLQRAVWQTLISLMLALPYLLAQETDREQKIRELEQKILVIEDYLKTRLQQIDERLENQRQEISKLRQQNAELQKELTSVKQNLREAESTILKLQIEINASDRAREVTAQEPKEETTDIQYANPEVQKLVPDLKSPHANVRMAAVLKLSQIEGEDAVTALIRALEDEDPYIQMLLCKVLAQRKAYAAIPEIFPLLKSSNREVRRVACECLKKITGVDSKYNPDDAEEIREKAISEWLKEVQEKKLTGSKGG